MVMLFYVNFLIHYFPKTVLLNGKDSEEVVSRNVKSDAKFLFGSQSM